MIIYSDYNSPYKYFRTVVNGEAAVWVTDWSGPLVVAFGAQHLFPNLGLFDARQKFPDHVPLWNGIAAEYVEACRSIRDRPRPGCAAL